MNHFILTNFKTKKKNGKTLTIRNANGPSSKRRLFYSNFKLSHPRPSDNTLKKKCLTVDAFTKSASKKWINEIVNNVMASSAQKRDVLLFTHGYTPLPKSHKLSLLYDLDEKYVQGNSKIGTIIYFSWPGFGLSMSNMLGEAYEMGEQLATHIAFFAELSTALTSVQSKMHLMVQSWGNRVLCGMLNKLDLRTHPFRIKHHRVFQNIFLMAADCPSKSLRQNGVTNAYRNYNLRRLENLSHKIYVFFDPEDGILDISKNQVELDLNRLGTIGFPPNKKFNNFHFIDVSILDTSLPHPKKLSIKNARHRYFVTSKKVVSNISQLISEQSV